MRDNDSHSKVLSCGVFSEVSFLHHCPCIIRKHFQVRKFTMLIVSTASNCHTKNQVSDLPDETEDHVSKGEVMIGSRGLVCHYTAANRQSGQVPGLPTTGVADNLLNTLLSLNWFE